MKLINIFALAISISCGKAEQKNAGGIDLIADNIDCSVHIGERDELDVRHRRMVDFNLLRGHCEDSDIIDVHIPHDGIKRSFNKVQVNISNDGIEQKIRKTEAIAASPAHQFVYWYGEDADDGSTFNYVQDEDGNIHGSLIDISSHSVMQISIENGNHTVIITDSSHFKPEIPAPLLDNDEDFGERKLSPEITESNAPLSQKVHRSKPRSYLRRNNSPPEEENQDYKVRALNNDSGDILDVMVVWTKMAECKNFGLSEECTVTDQTAAAMEAKINLAVDETNTAFELSGVETRLFLAHSYRHPTFTEMPMMTDSLSALQAGEISGTEQNRATYGADIVVMMLHDNFYCGSAYLGPRIDKMYSVTAWNCATGYFSFGHEIGHNLGLRHDRGTEYDCDSKKYFYGYRDPQARFRTILAYDCIPGQCDHNAGGGCTRIQRFSNPDSSWNGIPVGTPNSNAVKRINKVKSEVAGYFPHGGTSGISFPAISSPSSMPLSIPVQHPGPFELPDTTSTRPSKSPTSSPSSKPSKSSDAGSVLPSHVPSLSPVLSPPISVCKDSPLEFEFQQKFINCVHAYSHNLCSNTEIQAMCPLSCGTCSNCVDPNLKLKFFSTVKGRTQTKGCDVIADRPSVRCNFYGVSDSCRATCGTC